MRLQDVYEISLGYLMCRTVKEGLPPEMLQKILGHADYSTTANIYTHIDAETLVSAVTDALLTRQEKGKKKKP